MITESLSTLKINKLTQAQYDRELAAGRINENELYLVPDNAAEQAMNANNPVGTGSFSMNRQSDRDVGECSSTFGHNCVASGSYAHAEGQLSEATGQGAHAEGMVCFANGIGSHAEGANTEANGYYSHAEGDLCKANGTCSHAEGCGTIAYGASQHVQGQYNIPYAIGEREKYAHIVGNGTETTASNAHTLDWIGNAWFAGDVYVGSTSGTDMDSGSVKLATMNDALPPVTTADNGKVLMVVNGKWQLVNLNLTVDENGVVSVSN